jgi:hypothetical protein
MRGRARRRTLGEPTLEEEAMKGYSATVLVAILFAAGGASAVAAEPAAPYTIDVVALTGPQGGDLIVELAATDGSPVPGAFEHIHVKLHRPGADETEVVNLNDVPARNGAATVDLGPLERGTAVEVHAQVRDEKPPRTVVLREETTALLRPDLVVATVHAPPQTLSTRPVDVVADLVELNGDVGAKATVELMLGPTPVAEAKTVTIPKGGSLSVAFPDVHLTAAITAELTVVVKGAAPFETDDTNNSRGRTVEVTEHELVRSNVVVPSLGGYGAQFNQHVYAPVTNPPAATLPDLEAKVKALEPQLVRIFYNDDFEERQPNRIRNLASFVDTVQLAHEAGATINITYQAVNVAKNNPVTSMTRFAGVLEDLVEVKGYTNVRWVTVANEPNGGGLTMPEYEALNRALDAQLVERGLREHIRLMGGDLIRDGQRAWFQYIAANMNDLFDAYSVHIYWNYWDTPFFLETRLKDVHRIVTEELPAEARKPTYVMEYGVRGIRNFPGKPNVESGYWDDGTDLARTNIAAFQQLWFDLAAVQLGFTGSVKWDAYWGKYNAGYNSLYAMIGPAAEGWPLFPTYHAVRLLLQTTQAGWRVVQVAPWEENDWKLGVLDQEEKELAAYASDDGQLTLMGLDTHGLPPLTELRLAIWNATGNGETVEAGTVATNAAGVARFQVPLHAAFSLTTVPIS